MNLPQILLVDDDVDIVPLLSKQLEGLLAEVSTASTKNAAMELIFKHNRENKEFDLIIFDMWVPRETKESIEAKAGLKMLEALRHFRNVDPLVPVIIYTAYPTYEDCVACIKWGAFDYLPKSDGDRNNMEYLIDECRSLLYPNHEMNPLNSWASKNKNWEIAREKYPGKVIGFFDRQVAAKAGLNGPFWDGFVIKPFDSEEELGEFMLMEPSFALGAPNDDYSKLDRRKVEVCPIFVDQGLETLAAHGGCLTGC